MPSGIKAKPLQVHAASWRHQFPLSWTSFFSPLSPYCNLIGSQGPNGVSPELYRAPLELIILALDNMLCFWRQPPVNWYWLGYKGCLPGTCYQRISISPRPSNLIALSFLNAVLCDGRYFQMLEMKWNSILNTENFFDVIFTIFLFPFFVYLLRKINLKNSHNASYAFEGLHFFKHNIVLVLFTCIKVETRPWSTIMYAI
jgi:hypothetical protein